MKRSGESDPASVSDSLSSRLADSGLDADLRDLVARGLLHYDAKEGRFDLHPIVRRYAYDRLAAPDRAAVHMRLRDYFAAVPEPDKVTCLEDLSPVIELYHHTVRSGKFDEARTLLRNRLMPHPLFFEFGTYQLCIDLLLALFPDGEDALPHLDGQRESAWTLNELANCYYLTGRPLRAALLQQRHNAIYENLNDNTNLVVGLGNLAQFQISIGAFRSAEAVLRRGIGICVEGNNQLWEAASQQKLGRLFAYCGAWAESASALESSQRYDEMNEDMQGLSLDFAYRALHQLLLLRSAAVVGDERSRSTVSTLAIRLARRALELVDETARVHFSHPRDYVRTNWLLGAAYCVAGQAAEAEHHLYEALERCRRINATDNEADILLEIARLRLAGNEVEAAHLFANDALVLAERSGFVLQSADAHIMLARLARSRGNRGSVRHHATEAKRLAICDGTPNYTYKVAYDEAVQILNQLGDTLSTDLERSLMRVEQNRATPAANINSETSKTNSKQIKARVFISHSSADKGFVRRLVQDLEKRSLKVWLDERELRPGDSIVQGIEGGLRNTDYMVIVLSKTSVQSRWVRAELDAAMMDRLSGGGTVILPVIIDDCDVPPLLKTLVYADFRHDYVKGMESLLQTLDNEALPAGDIMVLRDRQPPQANSDAAEDCPAKLMTLTLGELRRRIIGFLNRGDVADVWYDTFNGDMMDDELPSKPMNECVRFLIDRARKRGLLFELLQNLCRVSVKLGDS